MPTLPDAKFAALRGLGYSGAMSDMMLQFWNAGLSGGGPGPGDDLVVNLTAGVSGSFNGFIRTSSTGSVDRDYTDSGRFIRSIETANDDLRVSFHDEIKELPQDYFTSINIPGVTSETLFTADATSLNKPGSGADGRTEWRWQATGKVTKMTSGQQYEATISGLPSQLDNNNVYFGVMDAEDNGVIRGYEIGVTGSPAAGTMNPATVYDGVWDWSRLATLAPGLTRSDIALPQAAQDLDETWAIIECVGIDTQTFVTSTLRVDRNSAGVTEGYRYWIFNSLDLNFKPGEQYRVSMRNNAPLEAPFYTATMTAAAGPDSRTGSYLGTGLTNFGSIVPQAIDLSTPTNVIGLFQLALSFNEWDFGVTGDYGEADTEFTTIRVTGITDPGFIKQFPASAMTRVFAGGETFWRVTDSTPYVVGDEYLVELFGKPPPPEPDYNHIITAGVSGNFIGYSGVDGYGSVDSNVVPGETYTFNGFNVFGGSDVTYAYQPWNVPNTDATYQYLVVTGVTDPSWTATFLRTDALYSGTGSGNRTLFSYSGANPPAMVEGHQYQIDVYRT